MALGVGVGSGAGVGWSGIVSSSGVGSGVGGGVGSGVGSGVGRRQSAPGVALFWRGGRSRFRCGERRRFRRIAMLLRLIRRCNLRKRSRIHPDDIAGRPSDLSAGEVKQRRNEQDVKGGDVNQIPPEVRVTHESRKRDRRRDAEYCRANHSSPPCCPPSRRVMTPTRPIPTRFRMSITSMNF